MTCSVIIVTYGAGPALFASIKGVLAQQGLKELIVVDNGNTPDLLARLQQMSLGDSRLHILTGQGNVGFAAACNLGAAQATGEFLLLLDEHCLLPPDALTDMQAAMQNTPEAAMASCKIVCADGSVERSPHLRLLTPAALICDRLGIPRRAPVLLPDVHAVDAVSREFLFLHREDYQQMSGMDGRFFLYMEDVDFCLRVRQAGGKIICVPNVQVTRMPRATTDYPPRWQRARGMLAYSKKHFSRGGMKVLLPLVQGVILLRFALDTFFELPYHMRRKPVISQSVPDKRLMILASGLAELEENGQLKDKTVLVTGATSQAGLCVLRRLISSGASVLALSRAPIPFQHECLRWIKGDLTDHALHLEGYLADVVVHCAPLWHLPPTLSLLADAEVKRVIAFGSSVVFTRALSRNSYEREMAEKLALAETEITERCKERQMQWTILRPTITYGVGLDLGITSLAKFIHRFGFFPIYPPALGRRQPVHADDLALAVLQAVNHEATYGKTYNLSGSEILSFHEMIERLFDLCRMPERIVGTTLLPFILDVAGWVSRKRHINGELARRMNDDLIFFHDEATRDFGFAPRAFLSGGIRDIEGF